MQSPASLSNTLPKEWQPDRIAEYISVRRRKEVVIAEAGALKGNLHVAEDFDALLSATLLAAFERNRIAAIENHPVVLIAASLLT